MYSLNLPLSSSLKKNSYVDDQVCEHVTLKKHTTGVDFTSVTRELLLQRTKTKSYIR